MQASQREVAVDRITICACGLFPCVCHLVRAREATLIELQTQSITTATISSVHSDELPVCNVALAPGHGPRRLFTAACGPMGLLSRDIKDYCTNNAHSSGAQVTQASQARQRTISHECATMSSRLSSKDSTGALDRRAVQVRLNIRSPSASSRRSNISITTHHEAHTLHTRSNRADRRQSCNNETKSHRRSCRRSTAVASEPCAAMLLRLQVASWRLDVLFVCTAPPTWRLSSLCARHLCGF